MKKQQLIILIIILTISFIGTFLYFKKTETDLEVKKKEILKSKYETLIIKNSFINYELTANGIIYELPVQNIKFEMSGDLMQGEKILISGDEFLKNQLLFRINNTDAFTVLAEKKSNLALLLKNLTLEIETEIPLAKTKWVNFLNEIKPIKRLPELPKDFPPNERIFLIKKGFIQEYVKTSMLEKEMEKYFYLAPFDGKYVQTLIEVGQKIESGTSIAQIAEKTKLLAKITINKNDLKLYKNQKHVHFVTNKGKKIGNGEFLNLSKKKKKSKLIDIIYTIQDNSKTFSTGTKLKIKTEHTTTDKSVAIPFEAIKGNVVKILVNENVVSKTVTIIGQNSTHYFIVGLTDGDQLILKED